MIKIDNEIFENNEGLMIGVLEVSGIDNQVANPEIANLLREAEEQLRNDFDSDEINQHPNVMAWREIHKRFGNNPKRYAPSVWAVTKRVIKGGQLPAINNLVDLYNYICLKYVVPVGGEDLDKCEGDVWMTYAKGDEEFVEIGGNENNPPQEGEIIYKDDKGVLCRKFNWREGDRTKLTEETKNAIVVVEALLPMNKESLEKALEEFKELIQKYCGGNIKSYILDKDDNF